MTENVISKNQLLFGIAITFLFSWFFNTLLFDAAPVVVNCVWLGMVACCSFVILSFRRRVPLQALLIPSLLAASFLMQFLFVLRMPYNFSWHDLGGFDSLEDNIINGGHLGIIRHIVKSGGLPSVNPMLAQYKDYYHPPLFHVVQAIFLKCNLWLGIPLEAALENLQIPTLFASSLCLWIIWRILHQLRFSRHGQWIGMSFAALQPAFFIYGATLNNDIFSLLFIFLTILYTLQWMEAPSLRCILPISLSIGLGMATKLSLALIAIPVGFVFAIRFFQNLSQWKSYLRQFSFFLLICAPLGLGWQLYQLFVFQVPLNQIPLPAATLNVGHLSISMRFGIPDGAVVRSLFYSGIRKTDYNVWFQTLKTALFDELTLYPLGSFMWYMSYLLTALFAVLCGIAVLCFLRFLLQRKSPLPPLPRIFLGMYSLVLMGSYLLFCFQYPYVCTFNFRYIFPFLLLGAIALASFFQKPALSGRLILFPLFSFNIVSCIVYGTYLFGKTL